MPVELLLSIYRRAGLASECLLSDFLKLARSIYSDDDIRATLAKLEGDGQIVMERAQSGQAVIVRTSGQADVVTLADVWV